MAMAYKVMKKETRSESDVIRDEKKDIRKNGTTNRYDSTKRANYAPDDASTKADLAEKTKSEFKRQSKNPTMSYPHSRPAEKKGGKASGRHLNAK